MIEALTRDELLGYMPTGMVWAELGVFKGEFSELILQKTEPRLVHLVDIWDGRACNGGKDGNYDEIIEDMKEVYHQLACKYARDHRIVLWRCKTETFLDNFKKYLPMKLIDVVYIDAEHDYKSVKSELIKSYGVTRRYILGHDYEPKRFPGVVKAVNEFCDEMGLKVTHLTEDGCPTYLIPLT